MQTVSLVNSSKYSWINTNWQSFLKSFKNKQTNKQKQKRRKKFQTHFTRPALLWWQNQKVQFSYSVVSNSATSRTAAHQASLSITNYWNLLKLMSIESVMPSNRLILCGPFLLLPSIFPSIRVLSSESVLHIRWPKYWFQLQHQSFQWIFTTDFL